MRQLPHRFSGKVIHGAGRGKTLGFPTANLDVSLPADLPLGIYAGWVIGGTSPRPALVYWGTRPTFNETTSVCEVYLLDDGSDLYESELAVEIIKFLRPDRRFDTTAELIDQMQQDVAEARRLLA